MTKEENTYYFIDHMGQEHTGTEKYFLFYHANCPDGIGAAAFQAAVLQKLGVASANIILKPILPNSFCTNADTVLKEITSLEKNTPVIIYLLDVAPQMGKGLDWFKPLLENKNVRSVHLVDHHRSLTPEESEKLVALAYNENKIFDHKYYVPEENGGKYDKAGIGLIQALLEELTSKLSSQQKDSLKELFSEKVQYFVKQVSKSDLTCSGSVAEKLNDEITSYVQQINIDEVIGKLTDKEIEYLGKEQLSQRLAESFVDILLSKIIAPSLQDLSSNNVYDKVEQWFDIEYCIKNIDIKIFQESLFNTQIYTEKNAVVYSIQEAPISEEIKNILTKGGIEYILLTQGSPEHGLRFSDQKLYETITEYSESKPAIAVSIKHKNSNESLRDVDINFIKNFFDTINDIVSVSIRFFNIEQSKIDEITNGLNEFQGKRTLGGRGKAVGGGLEEEFIFKNIFIKEYCEDVQKKISPLVLDNDTGNYDLLLGDVTPC